MTPNAPIAGSVRSKELDDQIAQLNAEIAGLEAKVATVTKKAAAEGNVDSDLLTGHQTGAVQLKHKIIFEFQSFYFLREKVILLSWADPEIPCLYINDQMIDWLDLFKKSEAEGNKYELVLSSQQAIARIALKKPKSTEISYNNLGNCIVTPNPPKYQVSGTGTYDFQLFEFKEPTTYSVTVSIDPIEGTASEPCFYVTPFGGLDFCQVIQIPIKPLSAHEKVSEYPASGHSNSLRVKGAFDLNTMNNWLFQILSDVSVMAGEKELTYNYYSRVTNTHLQLVVSDGLLTVNSQSVVPITIISLRTRHSFPLSPTLILTPPIAQLCDSKF